MCSGTLLRSCERDPERPQSAPQLTTRSPDETSFDSERREVPAEWTGTEAPYETDRCIHEFIEAQVERTPDALCIAFQDEQMTYREVNERANRLAHYLRALGVGREVLVAIYMARCPGIVVAILAVLKAGGAYIPVDASFPRDRLAAILADAGAPVLITHESLAAEAGVALAHVVCLDRDADTIAAFSSANPARTGRGDDAAFALFTSGSTGKPKGVLVMHRNLVNYRLLWEKECALSTSVSALCQTAFFSFAVFQGDVVRALCSGRKLVLCSREDLLSARALHALMKREGTDFAEFVPTLLRNLIGYLRESGERLDFMRVLVVGADRWYLREHREARRHLAPGTRLIHVYGSSETTLDSTRFERSDVEPGEDQPTPIGRPFGNVRVYILDDRLQPVGVGAEGELCIGGAGVAKGYLNLPELTATKFVPDPFSDTPGARLFRTGDMARWLPDGNIAFLGRRDQQLKLRGFRIEAGEIEHALERHANVASAVVQAVAAAADTQMLVGYVVPRGRAPTEDELRLHLSSILPDFMVPARFVSLESMPLTPSGKIDRRALPPPDTGRPTLTIPYTAARDELEQAIAEIWQRVLKVDRVGAEDNFADLGGTSLLMAEANALLRARLQRDIPIVQMYRHPTVSSLARSLRQAGADASPARSVKSRAGTRRDMRSHRGARWPLRQP